VPINITIKRPGGDFGFIWECSSDEAQKLWDECETMAAQQGRNAHTVAAAAIQSLYDRGEPKTEVAQRGLQVWITYAVLHAMNNSVDLDKMIDQAGVLEGPISIFDLAEHQTIKADVQMIERGEFKIKLSGQSPLDS
jgi:hypothetical protein